MLNNAGLIFLAVATLLVLSVLASKFSDRFGIPSLLIFLAIGMVAGSEGIGGIYFDDPGIAQMIGLFALSIILFSGGLDTQWDSLRKVLPESLVLSTLGVVLTAAILGFFAYFILGIPLMDGMLIGAITSCTDAAAVFSLLRSSGVRLKKKLAILLELESGSNDPMAVFLTIGIIYLIQNPGQSVVNLIFLFIQQMGLGGFIGYIFGKILLFLINRLRLGYDGLYPVLTLGILLLAFAVTTLLDGSGFLAVYIVGLSVGREDFLHKRSLSRFFDSLAWLSQIIMFLVLGLLVFPSRLIPVILPGILLSAILIFLARPISVWLSLVPFKYSVPEKHFIAWVGLRGAVPIILATYPRLAGLDGTGLIFNVVFFVVISSVLIQGTTIPVFARLLKLDDKVIKDPSFPLEIKPLQEWKGILQEISVPERSQVIGKAIFQLKLPPDYLVVLIVRDGGYIIPNGSFELKVNDRVLGIAKPDTHQIVCDLINAKNAAESAV